MAKKKVKELEQEPVKSNVQIAIPIDLTESFITGEEIKFKIIWSTTVCEMQNFNYLTAKKKDIYAYLRDDETVGLGFEDNTSMEFDKDIIMYTQVQIIDEQFIQDVDTDIKVSFAIYLTYQDYLDNKAVYVKSK